METIFILFVLIVALIGLRNRRLENEATWNSFNELSKYNGELIEEKELLEEQIDDFVRNNTYWQDEYTKENKSNKALKGWNTKYKETIDELKEEGKDLLYRLKRSIKSESIITPSLGNKIDESKILTEKLLTMVKKKDMEEAKAIVKEYYKM